MRIFIPRFLGTGLYFLVLTVVGVIGYMVLQGWNFHDALYMTVITLTAVGYAEVLPLTTVGRNFTMFLLAGGITGMALWFALITTAAGIEHARGLVTCLSADTDNVFVCLSARDLNPDLTSSSSTRRPIRGGSRETR